MRQNPNQSLLRKECRNQNRFVNGEKLVDYGMARKGRGELDKALQNYNTALTFNLNFSPAREAKEQLLAGQGA